MGEKFDEAKGRAKEAVGDLTDDAQLRREGKLDRAGASDKGRLNDLTDKAEELVDDGKRKPVDVMDRVGK